MPVSNTQPVYPPASGSPVASTWGQAVSEGVIQRFTSAANRDANWTTPPEGAMCVTTDNYIVWVRRGGAWRQGANGQIIGAYGYQSGGLTYTVPALYDIVNLPAVGAAPVQCTVQVHGAVHFGFAGGPVNAGCDAWGFAANTTIWSGGSPMQAIAGAFLGIPITYALNAAVGVDTGSKIRIGITALTGTCYVYAWATALVIAQ